jgi:FAD/FMN-containing dehydrogenase
LTAATTTPATNITTYYQIGGNLSTHAGGVKFVRHGPLTSYVLALEVVDGSGRILNLGSKMRKVPLIIIYFDTFLFASYFTTLDIVSYHIKSY